ncbi:MAG: DUF1697 domain-containing protein [Lentimicrobium sp.]|nr:DUF1697 domain-containing protein [Lentimicrobium sp.]
METYVALLRGVNVSGKNLIKMGELVKVLSEAGLSNVRTYIQSGNIVFESETTECEKYTKIISGIILGQFGLEVPVQVLKRSELSDICDKNPFISDRGFSPDKLYLTLLNAFPDPDLTAGINPENYYPDEFQILGKAVYLYCPSGYGNTKLTNTFFEKKIKVSATTRNWATVTKLVTM